MSSLMITLRVIATILPICAIGNNPTDSANFGIST